MKKAFLIFTAACAAISFQSYAQKGEEPSANYYKTTANSHYGVSLLGGLTTPHTDVNTKKSIGFTIGVQGRIKANYFLDAALDAQIGKLSAGDSRVDVNSVLMNFDNNIMNITALARLSPLKLLKTIPYKSPLYYLSNLYLGTGIGLLKSNVVANRFTNSDFVYIGNYSGTDALIPVEIGIIAPIFEMKNKSSISLNLNYRVSYVMSDKIDGYITPPTLNERKDVYNTFNVGIGYSW